MGKKSQASKVTVDGKQGVVLGPVVKRKGQDVQEVGFGSGNTVYVPTDKLK